MNQTLSTDVGNEAFPLMAPNLTASGFRQLPGGNRAVARFISFSSQFPMGYCAIPYSLTARAHAEVARAVLRTFSGKFNYPIIDAIDLPKKKKN